jgi:hypothetical protein
MQRRNRLALSRSPPPAARGESPPPPLLLPDGVDGDFGESGGAPALLMPAVAAAVFSPPGVCSTAAAP